MCSKGGFSSSSWKKNPPGIITAKGSALAQEVHEKCCKLGRNLRLCHPVWVLCFCCWGEVQGSRGHCPPSAQGKAGNLLLQPWERQLGRTRVQPLAAGRGLMLFHRTTTLLDCYNVCAGVVPKTLNTLESTGSTATPQPPEKP